MTAYLDNAATTPLDEAVFEAMLPFMKEHYGNPSSIHGPGRKVRTAIEQSRKKVAELLSCTPGEIFFTSGGTEADNMALRCTVQDKGIKHIVSTKIEHHAVLHTLEALAKEGVEVSYLSLSGKGEIDYEELNEVLKDKPNSMVTLMHGNNEIGNLHDLQQVGEIAKEHGAYFHSDTVQTMAHFEHDFSTNYVDFAVGSAHKFHGPKGVGFLYINHRNKINPFILGGAQERNMRGGTENVYGIVGLAQAMEIALDHLQAHRERIKSLKQRMIDRFKEKVGGVAFNGASDEIDHSLYTVLNVDLPATEENDMLLFNLDIEGISASGGSACSSGSNVGSHVLAELERDPVRGAIRFSFSKYNTVEEIDFAVDKVAQLYSGSPKV